MKIVGILLFLVALSNCQCPSTYGWSTSLSQTGTVGSGYVIGNNITVLCDSKITAFDGIFASSTSRFYVGLYSDNNGSPADLIAGAPATYTQTGLVRIPLSTPVNVAPGKYWLMVLYEAYSYPLYTTSNSYQPVKYSYVSYSSGLPSSLTGSYVYGYTGSTYNFYIETSGNACPSVLGQPNPFITFSSHSPNYILGNQVNISCDSYILSLGAYFNTQTGQFQLALYSDYGGSPYELIAYTFASATKAGSNLIALYNPVEVSAGTYWLMGFYQQQSYPGYNTSNSNVVVKYVYRSFSSGLPDYFGSATTYTGQLFNYWIQTQTSSCPTQVGWPNIFYDVSSHSANYALGNAVNITCASFATGLNAYFSEGTGKFMMALYSDDNGSPDTLLVATGSKSTQAGEVHFGLTPQLFLTEGTYWLMALYETPSFPGFNETDPNVVVKYISRSFSTGFPFSFGSPGTYHGQVFNYWIDVTPGDDN